MSNYRKRTNRLNLAIQKLLARLRGHRSERSADPAQQKLDFGDDPSVQDGLADAAAEAEQILQEYTVRRTLKKRKPRTEELPAHLPRYEVLAEVPPAEQHCAQHGPRQLIGYDLTETLEFERPKLWVRVTKYPKLVCQDQPQCGVVQPPRPAGLVEGNRYDTSIAAEIIAAKYAYHQPTYRQQDWFAGSGWMPQRSTLLNILSSAAYVLEPLYHHSADYLRTAQVIPTDETRVMLLLRPTSRRPGTEMRNRGEFTKCSARHWLRTSRTCRLACGPIAAWVRAGRMCSTSPCRGTGTVPQDFLKNYSGTLLGDCYTGFESIVLASDDRLVRAACHGMRGDMCTKHGSTIRWKHRSCWPGTGNYTTSRIRPAANVPRKYSQLRRQLSVPIMDQLRQWLDGDAARKVLPKSRLGKPCGI